MSAVNTSMESKPAMEARPLDRTEASGLDRKIVGKYTLEQVLYVAIILLAIFLRTYHLGVRPYHHDESIHAFFSWKIVQNGPIEYRYDPVYHGPLLYFASAAMMWLFGDNDFTGRLSAVLFGLGVIAFAWPLRKYLGRWGALSFLLLVTFSPAWTYFTRFVRHDIYLALCNIAAVYFAFRYGDTRKSWYLYASAAALSLAFCDKEDMYLITPIFLFALGVMMLWGVVRGQQKLGEALRETGSLLSGSVVAILTSLVIFAIIWGLLYTSFGAHPENWNGIGRALTYWWGQQQVRRIGGPWWYYVPQLLIYEPLIILPGLAYAVSVALSKTAPSRFARFMVVWGIGMLFIYAWAQEKVPWLLIPQLAPMTILAALWFGRVIDNGTIFKPAVLLPTTAVAVLTIWTLIASNFLYDAPRPDEPAPKHETMLSYVQSTYDIPNKVMKNIEEVGRVLGSGTQTRLAVSGDATWPLSWYLRHYPVNWSANLRNIDQPVVVVDKDVAKSTDDVLLPKYKRVPFAIRGWWEPTWNIGTKPTLSDIVRYLVTREVWSPTGTSDAVMYVYKDLKAGEKIGTFTVNPPPAARGYPMTPKALEPVGVFGRAGKDKGEFNELRDLAVDHSNHLYVIDTKNDRVQKLSTDGQPLLVWGSEGSEPGQFKDPYGLAVGPDDSVYVADTWNHRIQQFDPNGRFLRQWTASDPGFWGPRGVAVAKDGTVFVTDTGNKRVCSYSAIGIPIECWGTDGSAPGQFIEPVGIAVTSAGEVVVADTGNRRLQFFLPGGEFQRQWPVYGWEEFYSEPYIAALGDDIYVTDSYNHRFARYRDGKLTGVWGTNGTAPGKFNRPIGIAALEPNILFVGDTMNNRIQKFEIPEE
jgi:uncharacterized protein (TIGR03663 family)